MAKFSAKDVASLGQLIEDDQKRNDKLPIYAPDKAWYSDDDKNTLLSIREKYKHATDIDASMSIVGDTLQIGGAVSSVMQNSYFLIPMALGNNHKPAIKALGNLFETLNSQSKGNDVIQESIDDFFDLDKKIEESGFPGMNTGSIMVSASIFLEQAENKDKHKYRKFIEEMGKTSKEYRNTDLSELIYPKQNVDTLPDFSTSGQISNNSYPDPISQSQGGMLPLMMTVGLGVTALLMKKYANSKKKALNDDELAKMFEENNESKNAEQSEKNKKHPKRKQSRSIKSKSSSISNKNDNTPSASVESDETKEQSRENIEQKAPLKEISFGKLEDLTIEQETSLQTSAENTKEQFPQTTGKPPLSPFGKGPIPPSPSLTALTGPTSADSIDGSTFLLSNETKSPSKDQEIKRLNERIKQLEEESLSKDTEIQKSNSRADKAEALLTNESARSKRLEEELKTSERKTAIAETNVRSLTYNLELEESRTAQESKRAKNSEGLLENLQKQFKAQENLLKNAYNRTKEVITQQNRTINDNEAINNAYQTGYYNGSVAVYAIGYAAGRVDGAMEERQIALSYQQQDSYSQQQAYFNGLAEGSQVAVADAQQMADNAFNNGKSQGYDQGKKDGYQQGHIEAMQKSWKDFIKEGKELWGKGGSNAEGKSVEETALATKQEDDNNDLIKKKQIIESNITPLKRSESFEKGKTSPKAILDKKEENKELAI